MLKGESEFNEDKCGNYEHVMSIIVVIFTSCIRIDMLNLKTLG